MVVTDIYIQTDDCVLSDIAITSEGTLALTDTSSRVWQFCKIGRQISCLDALARSSANLPGPWVEAIPDGLVVSYADTVAIFKGSDVANKFSLGRAVGRVAYRTDDLIVCDPAATSPPASTFTLRGDQVTAYAEDQVWGGPSFPVLGDQSSLHMIRSSRGEVHSYNNYGYRTGTLDFGPARYADVFDTLYEISEPDGTNPRMCKIYDRRWAVDACWCSSSRGISVLHGAESEQVPMLWFVQPDSREIQDCFLRDSRRYTAVARFNDNSLFLLAEEREPSSRHLIRRVDL